jgi:hypothetical protein
MLAPFKIQIDPKACGLDFEAFCLAISCEFHTFEYNARHGKLHVPNCQELDQHVIPLSDVIIPIEFVQSACCQWQSQIPQ